MRRRSFVRSALLGLLVGFVDVKSLLPETVPAYTQFTSGAYTDALVPGKSDVFLAALKMQLGDMMERTQRDLDRMYE